MSVQNDSPRVIGGIPARGAKDGLVKDRNYSKTIVVTTGGYLDSLPARERQSLIEGDLSQAALDYGWDVHIAGQHWN